MFQRRLKEEELQTVSLDDSGEQFCSKASRQEGQQLMKAKSRVLLIFKMRERQYAHALIKKKKAQRRQSKRCEREGRIPGTVPMSFS